MTTFTIIYLQCFTRKILKLEATSYEAALKSLSFHLIELPMVSSVKDEEGVQLWKK